MAGARPPPSTPVLLVLSDGAGRVRQPRGGLNGSDQRCGLESVLAWQPLAPNAVRTPHAPAPTPAPPARCRRFAALGRATPRSPLPPRAQLAAEELAGAGARRQQSEPRDHYQEGAVEGEWEPGAAVVRPTAISTTHRAKN